jgi:hypothetical protein
MDQLSDFDFFTLEILIHKYLYHEMSKPLISDQEYDGLVKTWRSFSGYVKNPFGTPGVEFPIRHPLSISAAIEGKKRLGITS